MLDYPKAGQKRCRKKKDRLGTITLELLTMSRPEGEEECIPLDMARTPSDKHFDLKKEANRLVVRLAKAGKFSQFSKADQKRAEIRGKLPKGWIVGFKIPPVAGGRYEPSNLWVTTQEVNDLMYSLYWKQVAMELNSAILKGERAIQVMMPKTSQIFSLDDFWQFVQSHEHVGLKSYLAHKKKWMAEALKAVQVERGKSKIILRLKKRVPAPEGFRKVLIRAEPLSSLERDEVKAEYAKEKKEIVLQAMARGDFAHLSRRVQARIAQTGHVPADADLTCHHIIPRSVGGKNELSNVIFLSEEAHTALHKNYINPLMVYFDSLTIEKRAVYFEIPVPIGRRELPLFMATPKGAIVKLEDFDLAQAKKMRVARKRLLGVQKILRQRRKCRAAVG